MSDWTDERVMEAVRGGDVRQLSTLFDRYHAVLYRFYARMTGGRSAAEDLVQEVFWRILRYRQTYQPGAPFQAWVYQVARNVYHDDWRRRRREVPMDQEWDLAAAEALPLERQEEIRLLRQALLRLTPAKREVLVLHRFQGLKYEQIAEIQGCEAGTIKVRAHRALKELKSVFAELTEGKRHEVRTGSAEADRLPLRQPGPC